MIKKPEKRMRTIKSFVCRQGRLTALQAKGFEEAESFYILPMHQINVLNFAEIYSNPHPIILEIGFGMGASLLAQAEKNPNENFLGVEVHRPGIGALLSGMVNKKINNIRIVSEDILLHLEKIPDQSLAGVQIFFPDPWPKRRHHKRRLIQEAFVLKLVEKIKIGGFLHCATDWEDYAQQMIQVLNESKRFSFAEYHQGSTDRLQTKFESRGLKLGHIIRDIKVQRIS